MKEILHAHRAGNIIESLSGRHGEEAVSGTVVRVVAFTWYGDRLETVMKGAEQTAASDSGCWQYVYLLHILYYTKELGKHTEKVDNSVKIEKSYLASESFQVLVGHQVGSHAMPPSQFPQGLVHILVNPAAGHGHAPECELIMNSRYTRLLLISAL